MFSFPKKQRPQTADGQAPAAVTFPPFLWNSCRDQFMNLRTRIMDAFAGEGHKCLIVTSTFPQEGKTLVAMNLSRALAQQDRPTLLVDADLRLPDVHRHFGVQGGRGLGEALKERRLTADMIWLTDVPGLELLPAGGGAANPVELLDSDYTGSLLGALRERYSFVVIDSPPILPLADTKILARKADGILVVLEASVTPREALESALGELEGKPVLGLVVNGVRQAGHYAGYY